MHLGKSSRNTDQMADSGNKATRDGGQLTMIVEVFLTLFHFLLIEQAKMAKAAIGKPIDDGTPHIVSHYIVDGGPEIGS